MFIFSPFCGEKSAHFLDLKFDEKIRIFYLIFLGGGGGTLGRIERNSTRRSSIVYWLEQMIHSKASLKYSFRLWEAFHLLLIPDPILWKLFNKNNFYLKLMPVVNDFRKKTFCGNNFFKKKILLFNFSEKILIRKNLPTFRKISKWKKNVL